MRVGEVMTREVEFVPADANVQDAATTMAEHDIGAVLVGARDRLEGILTDRDVLLRVVVGGADPRQTLVRDVMSPTLFNCGVDNAIDDALREMHERQVRRLPVTDEAGRVLGIVARSDLVRARYGAPGEDPGSAAPAGSDG